jgi:hypothetical protein
MISKTNAQNITLTWRVIANPIQSSSIGNTWIGVPQTNPDTFMKALLYLPSQLTTQMAHLDAFAHVVECIFHLQPDYVICQALLASWGESDNPCTIYALLMVPLDTLIVNYSGT